MLDATSKLLDGRKLTDVKVPFIVKVGEKKGLKAAKGTLVETMLERYHLV